MKRAENQPYTISLTIFGGIYYRVWSVPDAGTIIPQHAHHWTIISRCCCSGSVRVWCDGELMGDFNAPDTHQNPGVADARISHADATMRASPASTTPTMPIRTASRRSPPNITWNWRTEPCRGPLPPPESQPPPGLAGSLIQADASKSAAEQGQRGAAGGSRISHARISRRGVPREARRTPPPPTSWD